MRSSAGEVCSVPSGEPATMGTSADTRLAAHDKRAVYLHDVSFERDCFRSVTGAAERLAKRSAPCQLPCANKLVPGGCLNDARHQLLIRGVHAHMLMPHRTATEFHVRSPQY